MGRSSCGLGHPSFVFRSQRSKGLTITMCFVLYFISCCYLQSATVQAVLTSINVAVLLLVIVVGLFLGVSAEWPGYQEKDG